MKKIVAVITCFNLIFSLIYPIFVLARETEDDPNANPNAECQTKFLYPECDWNSHQVYDVYQNTCTGDYSKENNRYQDGQCGYSSQPNFDASPQCQEGEVIDWCAKKECDPNIDNGRLVCFKEVKKADCSISLEVNNATEEKCGAALTAQILLDSGGNDPVSYYGGAIPATVEPSEVAPEEAAPTPTPQPPIFNTWDLGYSTQWDPTPEPAPAPIPAIIITSPTAQERALERYEKRAEAMDQYQDEVMANTRADESTSGNEVIYLPSKITGMVQNQIDKVEEGLNKIAESTTPKTREEVLQEERLARKEEQLNKLAQQQDAAVEADQKKQRDAIVAVQNMPADQRAAYLKDQGVIPQDIPTDQIDAKVRAAAVKSGLQIDGNITSGDFTISVGSATISAADIVNAGNAAGEFGLDTAMQGTYYLGKSALNLQGDMDKVDRLLGETGLASRQQLSPISGPGSLAGGYAVTLIRLQELKNDVDAYPDSTLTPEQQAKRKEYAEALRTLWEQQHQIAIDTAAAAAMTFVGAPLKIAKAGAAKVIPQSVQKAAGETGSSAWSWVSSKVGGLLGRGVKEGEEAVGGVAGSVFIKTEGKTTGSVAVKNLEVTERLRLNMEDAKEMYSDQDIDEARSLAQEVLGFTPSDDTIAIVVDALKGDKASREAIKERLSRVKSIVSHQEILLGSEGDNTTGRILVKAPPGTNDNVFTDDSERIVGVEDTWNTFRYNGVGSKSFYLMQEGKGFTQKQLREELTPDLLAASLDQYVRAQGLIRSGIIQKARDKFSKFRETVVSLGGDESSFREFDPERIVDPSKVVVVDREIMKYLIPSHIPGQAAAAFFDGGSKMVVELYNAGFPTKCHEWCHVMQNQVGPRQAEISMKIALGKDANGKANGSKLLEGLNETANQVVQNENVPPEFLSASALPTGNRVKWAYQPQVSAAHDQVIPLILKNNPGMSRERAIALVLEASAGHYDKLIRAAGGGNFQKGASALKKIYDQVEPIFSDPGDTIKVSRAITPVDIAMATGATVAIGAGAVGGAILLDQATKPHPTVNPSPRQLPLRLIQDVHAAEADTSSTDVAFNSDSFESLVKYNLVKQALEEDGAVEADYVKDVVTMDIIEPEVLKLSSGYLLTTGKAGTVEGSLEKRKYLVDISSILNTDIKTPSVVDLSLGDATIGIAVKEGSGKVEKVGYAGGRDGEASNSAKIKVVVFADDNGNGVIDNEEKALPWAGISVKLSKVNEENTVNLNAGWNLVSLTLLPDQTLTASGLLKAITDQKGQAVAVSTLVDGAWKSFVVRDGKEFSGDDFAIEVGKSYFVKALKPSTFKYSGQNLVAPVKVKVQSGWNAVGLPKTSKEYKASLLIDDVVKQASGSGTLAWWDFGLWDTFVQKEAGQYGNNFDILPGVGYIMKVEQEGEMTP